MVETASGEDRELTRRGTVSFQNTLDRTQIGCWKRRSAELSSRTWVFKRRREEEETSARPSRANLNRRLYICARFRRDGHNKKVQWFHPKCLFETFPTMRKSSRTVKSVEELEGFENLNPIDQRAIRMHLDGVLDQIAELIERKESVEADEDAYTATKGGFFVVSEQRSASEESFEPIDEAVGAELDHLLDDGALVVDETDATGESLERAPELAIDDFLEIGGFAPIIGAELGFLEEGGFGGGGDEKDSSGLELELDASSSSSSTRPWSKRRSSAAWGQREGEFGADETCAPPPFEEHRTGATVELVLENRIVAEENGMLILRAFEVPRLTPRQHAAKRHKPCVSTTPARSWESPPKRTQKPLPSPGALFVFPPPKLPNFATPSFWCDWNTGPGPVAF